MTTARTFIWMSIIPMSTPDDVVPEVPDEPDSEGDSGTDNEESLMPKSRSI